MKLKKLGIVKKEKNVSCARRKSADMHAKTEKLEGLFYASKTKDGCIMQAHVYTLVYFV